MVSARVGAFTVALGLGCAVLAAAGVASADTADANSGTDSSSSSQQDKSSADDTPSHGHRSAGDVSTSAEVVDRKHTSQSATESETDAEGAEAESDEDLGGDADLGIEGAVAADTDSDTAVDAERPDSSAVTDDVPAAEPVTADGEADQATAEPSAVVDIDAAATAPQTLVPAAAGDSTDGTPSEPVVSAALWSVAAAGRPELGEDPIAPSHSATIVDATNTVTAIEQVAPLAFLQRIPLLGPVLFTPIVGLLHQIPIVSDVLHPLVGYPALSWLHRDRPVSRDVRVASADGTEIYVHFMPAYGLATNAKAPTVLNGPGLGAPGATNIDGTFLDPILVDFVGIVGVGTLRRAGYNVVTWDPRGEWYSGGTLELNAAEFEGRDMSAIISWIASQPEVQLDEAGDPRLGMVGVSYGGAIQLVTAAHDSRVDAIVPAITYNRLDTSLYKNEAFKSSWATPLTALLTVLGGRINPRILPATVYGDLTGQLLPSDLELFVQRNPAIANITVPTLLIHGTVDTIFSLAEADATAQTLLTNGVTTKVVWFCGGHGVCAGNLLDLRDGVLIEQRTLAWLDRYVKEDVTVETGPALEWVDQRGQWFSSAAYPATRGPSVVATLAARRTLPLIPYISGSGLPFVPYALPAINGVELEIPVSTETTYLVGAPRLSLTYSGTGTARHVYAQLFDNTTGLVLGSIATPVPVTLDGMTHTITLDLEPVAHTLRPGESVTLQIVSSTGLYERILPSLGTLTISRMQVAVPTADPATVQPGAGLRTA